MTGPSPTRQICSECGRVSPVGFYVPDEVWEKAIPEPQQANIFCIMCFTQLADQKCLSWDNEISFYPTSKKTHRSQIREAGLVSIRKAREKRDMTQEELADLAQISRTYLSELERGNASSVSLSIAQRISAALGRSIDSLLFPAND